MCTMFVELLGLDSDEKEYILSEETNVINQKDTVRAQLLRLYKHHKSRTRPFIV